MFLQEKKEKLAPVINSQPKTLMKVKPRPIVLVDKVIPKKPVVVEKEEEVRLCIVLISQETKKTKHIISKC